MSLLEHPQPTERLHRECRAVSSITPSDFLSMVRAWDDVALFEEVMERMATIDEVERQLEASGVSHLPPLGPGVHVEYSHQDGSVVRGQLAKGADWVDVSTADVALLGHGTWELQDAWLCVEVPLTHPMFVNDQAPTQRIRVNARELGLLSEDGGVESRLRLLSPPH